MEIKVAAMPTVLIFQNSGQDIIAEYLKFNGFEVIETDEANVVQDVKEKTYQLCILDYYKDDQNLKLLNIIKKIDEYKPVIMVTEYAGYSHTIRAFREGADDYMARPCNVEELACRIRAILKRYKADSRVIEPFYKLGDLLFKVEERVIIRNNDFALTLSDREARVLAYLCAYKNEVVPIVFLLKKIWFDENKFNKRSLDVFMCKIRKKLAFIPNMRLETIRGYGYSLKEY